MSRVEENKRLMEFVAFNNGQEKNYDESIILKLILSTSILLDISQSLAVIADSMQQKEKLDES